MEIVKSELECCLIIKPDIFRDERGLFFESYNAKRYLDVGNIDFAFVQDNFSRSHKNVLRGLHFQIEKPQGKIVRVVNGSIFDVALDIRKNSKTFGKWTCEILSAENKKQFWIPPGFAHGFLTLSDVADLEYKCTDYYDPNDEETIIWNDPDLKIDWPSVNPIISEKDSEGKFLKDLIL